MSHSHEHSLHVKPSAIRQLGLEAALVWAAICEIRADGKQITTINSANLAELLPGVDQSVIQSSLQRLVQEKYLQKYHQLVRGYRLFFPLEVQMTAEPTIIQYEAVGQAPEFGGWAKKDQDLEPHVKDIFYAREQERAKDIAMHAEWEPTDGFYEQTLNSTASGVTRAQVRKELGLFRLHYGAEKARDQLKWEALFLKWLCRNKVFAETDAVVQANIIEQRTAAGTQRGSVVRKMYDINTDDVE